MPALTLTLTLTPNPNASPNSYPNPSPNPNASPNLNPTLQLPVGQVCELWTELHAKIEKEIGIVVYVIINIHIYM